MKLWPFRPDLVSPLLRLDAEQEASIAPLIDPNTPTYGELLEIAETLEKRLDETIVERDELVAALDWQRPAPSPTDLGPRLQTAWFRPRPTHFDPQQRWAEVAETAIDYIRGLWPLDVAVAVDPPEDPADTVQVGDQLGSRWVAFLCKRSEHHHGQHIATGLGEVLAVWPPETSSGGGGSAGAGVSTAAPTGAPTPDDPWPGPSTRVADDYAALTDAYLEDLARALCHHDSATTGLHWDSTVVALREGYFNLAAAVILAGWLPERLARAGGSTSPGVDG